MASLSPGPNILHDKIWYFGSGPIVGLPVGTKEDSCGCHSSVLHRFVVGRFAITLRRLTELNRNRLTEY